MTKAELLRELRDFPDGYDIVIDSDYADEMLVISGAEVDHTQKEIILTWAEE